MYTTINTNINGFTVTKLAIRVIMDDLFNVVPVKIYYSYHTEDDVFVDDGNLVLEATLGTTSLDALQDALSNALDVVPEMAMLRMWYIGTTLHHFSYRLAGDVDDSDKLLNGSYVTTADTNAIRDEVLQKLGLEQITNTAFPYTLPLTLS